VATIVVARDFLITGLRLLASAEGVILPAERMGKHKTSWQIVTVIFFLLLLSAVEVRPGVGGSRSWQNLWAYGGNTLLWITIGLTIYSGLGYLWGNRGLIIEPKANK
jgi:phosphatidylglycerophosphate synthase